MTEIETTVAAPFRHTRMSALTQMKFIYYYTQDKKWMSLEQSKNLIKIAERKGLISKNENGDYILSDSLADVKIPTGFRPTDDIFAGAEDEAEDIDPVESVIGEVSAKTGKDKKELVKEMQEIKSHFDNLIYTEAAVILLAKKYDTEISKYTLALTAKIESA
ncbi:MAG: DUF2240 family protein [Methanocorpusculum sp.]|nr:DUF2240 family protein [Methanocorpusculum sp.]